MTEPISLEFSGDCWNSPARFQQQLDQHPPGEPLILDLRSEGPSLSALGITTVVNAWLRTRRQSPDTVYIKSWSNPVEFVPYRRTSCSKISHFFFMAKDYWQHTEPTLEQQLQYQQPFGLFIGRLTFSRAAILYQAHGHDLFASLMNHVQPAPWKQETGNIHGLENLSDWLSLYDQARMFAWYDQRTVTSVDNKSVRDQFASITAPAETNASLLQHYHNFAVEIVCETYTLGDTFFPTEKTIRPIMAAKPVLVYAPRYYLARLRAMGFQTYHSLWDESYDLYEGPNRWRLMQQSMRTLQECGRADQHRILSLAHEIAQHNRQRLANICNYPHNIIRNHDYSKI
jgi:hypothetical protein